MKFRKFISILLAFVMVVMTLGLTPAAALADAPAVGSEENLQPDTSGEPEQSGESGEEIGLEHEHEWEKVDSESFDATCEEEGKTVYKCNVSGCEEQYEEYTYPLGHDFVDGVCRRCGAEEGVITADTWGALQKAFSRGGEVTVALSGNIEAGEGDKALTVPKGANVTLQLNGYTIDCGLTETASVMNGNVIIVLGELTVDGEGIITGGSTKGAGGGIWIRRGGKLTLNGGTVKGNYTQNTGGGVYLSGEGSCFTMTGGSITENKARNGGGAAIDNSGDIYACRRVADSKAGNVFEDRLADVWITNMEAYRNYDAFARCSRCKLKQFCRVCPAVAKGYTGDFYGDDPQCWASEANGLLTPEAERKV